MNGPYFILVDIDTGRALVALNEVLMVRDCKTGGAVVVMNDGSMLQINNSTVDIAAQFGYSK